MIHYPISVEQLHRRIDAINKTWRDRATKRTKEIESGSRKKITGMWSEIKPVYMSLQSSKCAFCEKSIEDQAIEQDVEHFRPKNEIRRWPIPKYLSGACFNINQPASGSEPGYRLLAYHPMNYVTSCKTCNSVFKKNYFPIAGKRMSGVKDPYDSKKELPYLIYPLGDLDCKPEQLIKFYALSPQPRRNGFDRLRAMVTIELFGLDNESKRNWLFKDRAKHIENLYYILKERDEEANDESTRRKAATRVKTLKSKKEPHSNCLRSYERLWKANRQEAQVVYNKIKKFLESKSE